jgi:neutral ceramidase
VAESLRAGTACVDITPPLGVCLAGHFNTRPASGLHDPLTAQAVVFALGAERLALVGCDLIGIPGELTSLVRERTQAALGLPPERLMLWGTHTHAGPIMNAGGGDPRDEAYFRTLAAQLAGAVAAAEANLQPAMLRVGWGREDRISYNRRYLMRDGSVRTNPGVGNPEISRVDGPKDPAVGALFVTGTDGLQAIVVNFACHLDVLGNGNFQFSADYPFYLRQALQAAYGRSLVIPFANGPCGNINHIDVFAGKRQGGYSHARMMGMMLAGEVLKLERGVEPLSVAALSGQSRTLELQRRPYSDEELAEFRRLLADDRIADRSYPKVRARTHLARHEQGQASEPTEVQVLRLGDLALCGVPAELFVEYGLQLREQSPARHTFVVELANDCIGYVPTPEAFDGGAYEGTSARFARDTGPRMAAAVLEML